MLRFTIARRAEQEMPVPSGTGNRFPLSTSPEGDTLSCICCVALRARCLSAWLTVVSRPRLILCRPPGYRKSQLQKAQVSDSHRHRYACTPGWCFDGRYSSMPPCWRMTRSLACRSRIAQKQVAVPGKCGRPRRGHVGMRFSCTASKTPTSDEWILRLR